MKNGKYTQIGKVSLLLLLPVLFGRSVVFAQQYDTLLGLKDFRRYNMLHIFLADADNKPQELKKIAEWVNLNGDDTEKEMLLSELEYNQLKSAGESIEKQIAFSEQYVLKANKSNNHYLLFRLYYRICDRYQALGLYNKSIENSLYCVDELKKGGNGTYFEQSWPLYQLGENFFRFGDFDRALELSLVAYKYYAINNRNPAWFVKACSNLIGVIYLKAEKFDLAKNWLDSTLYYSGIQKDTLWMGIAIGNMGTINYRKNDYVSAIPNFTKAISYCQKWKMWDNISPFATRLADSYFRTGQTQLVQAALDLAAEANKHDFKLVNRVDYFKVASNWYRSQGNSKLALEYADSNRLYQMKMDEEFSVLKKYEAEAKLAYRNKELENIILTQQERRKRAILYGIIITFLLLSIIGFLIFKRHKLKSQLHNEILENEKLKAEEQLHLALAEIKDFTYHIVEKNKLIQSYSEEIDKLKLKNTTITEDQLVSLEALRSTTVLTDQEWTSFKANFEKVHPGYLQRLKTNYPDLTPAETRYLVFTKLAINSKEMAAMMGVSAEAIRNIRFRLKKKLNFSDSDELDKIANEI